MNDNKNQEEEEKSSIKIETTHLCVLPNRNQLTDHTIHSNFVDVQLNPAPNPT